MLHLRRVGREVDGSGFINRTRFTAGRGFESLTRRRLRMLIFKRSGVIFRRVRRGSVTGASRAASSEGSRFLL
jgi:hypothetical protein